MKRFEIILLLLFAVTLAVLAGNLPTYFDGEQLITVSSEPQTNILFTLSTTNFSLCPVSVAEAALENQSQVLQAAAGPEIVTGLTATATIGTIWSATSSNVTVLRDGWYRIDTSGSLAYSAAISEIEGHMFTNGVELARVGWDTSFRNANDRQSVMGFGSVYMVSNTLVDFRLDADKNGTMTAEHFTLSIKHLCN